MLFGFLVQMAIYMLQEPDLLKANLIYLNVHGFKLALVLFKQLLANVANYNGMCFVFAGPSRRQRH